MPKKHEKTCYFDKTMPTYGLLIVCWAKPQTYLIKHLDIQNLMNIKSLQYFITLAKCKNFTAAAQECNISQPAFSRRIKALESELGVELTVHNKKTFQLTSAGERLFLHANRLLKDFDDLKTTIQIENLTTNQTVTLAMMSAISMTQLGRFYDKIMTLENDIFLRLLVRNTYDGLELLKKQQTDLFMTYASDLWAPSADKNIYRYAKIGEEKIIPVCRREFADYDLDSDDVIPILDHNANTVFGISINRLLEKKAKTNLNYLMDSDFSLCQYGILKQGHHAVCWLPLSMIQGDLDSGEFTHLGDGQWDLNFDIRLYAQNSYKSSLINTIMDKITL